MKKLLFFSLFISFKMFGQAPKMEVIVPNFGETDGIVGVLKTTNPISPYSAVKGRNYSSTAIGWGVYGTHDGYGTGVGGFALGGAGVTGNSTSGIGGRFSSTSGYALITGTGNVGIGLSTPTSPLDINGRIRLRNNGGSNTSGIWYDDDTALQRVFVGMETNDLFGFYGTLGWSFRFNATNGNIGISTVPTTNKLEVNGSIGSSSLLGSGNTQLYANATGTIINTPPVAFSVKNTNNNIPIANATLTTFPFSTEDYDLGSFFNTSTYEFNAPLTGIYHFDSNVTFGLVNSTFSTSSFELSLQVDGSTLFISTQPAVVGVARTLNLSHTIKLNAGQKVRIMAFQNTGNTINLMGTFYSNFSGQLVTRL